MSKINYAKDISNLVKEQELKLITTIDLTLNGCDCAFLYIKDNDNLSIYDHVDVNGILFNIFLNKENEKVWVSKDFNEENYTLHPLMVGQIALYLNETLKLGLDKNLIKKIAHFHDTEGDNRGIIEQVKTNTLNEKLKKQSYDGLEEDIKEGMVLSNPPEENIEEIYKKKVDSKKTINISQLATQIRNYGEKEHMLVKLADSYHQFFSGRSNKKLLIAKTLFYTKLFKDDLGKKTKDITRSLIEHQFNGYDKSYVKDKLSELKSLKKQYKEQFLEISKEYLNS
jgi:hypothetical protein